MYLTTVRNTLLTAFIQWPYSYDACDVGTAPNQTLNGRPESALTTGPAEYNYELSYLPGQRLSRCTCDGESHPGPKHADGTYVGRSAPEIDIFEAQVSGSVGEVSQSGQWAVSHHCMFSIFYISPDTFPVAFRPLVYLEQQFRQSCHHRYHSITYQHVSWRGNTRDDIGRLTIRSGLLPTGGWMLCYIWF